MRKLVLLTGGVTALARVTGTEQLWLTAVALWFVLWLVFWTTDVGNLGYSDLAVDSGHLPG